MPFKSFLPKSLFGRALLILVLPTVLIQVVMAYVFFATHWDNVTRHMAGTLAGETAFLVREIRHVTPTRRLQIVSDFEITTGMDIYFDPPASFETGYASDEFHEFQRLLHRKISESFTVRTIENGETIEIRVRLADQVMRLKTTVKRLESRTTTIFIVWMLGASILFLLIAVLFLRNQIRPIIRLAEAADNFGRGVDMPGFRPHGASEVRKAAKAFVIMRERIRRQLRTRTEMLAGISHDLRTPLTRMKLELAMLEGNGAVRDTMKELSDDVQQMEHMIQEYLDFARGEGREETTRVHLHELLQDVVRDYERLNANVALVGNDDVTADIRISGFRRMMHNLIDNALRYGRRCRLAVMVSANYCEIIIDDEGPGIPADKREEVFKPFNRLEHSRNVKTGGVGLGLTIARDIALAHGGSIALDTAPKGGLRVVIRLPL